MWFVFILESQDGKNGRQQERQCRGLHSHTLGRECAQHLLNRATNRAQGHHLGNGGITRGKWRHHLWCGCPDLAQGSCSCGAAPWRPFSVCVSQPWGRAGTGGESWAWGWARLAVRQLGRCWLALDRVSRTLLSPGAALSGQMWDV